MKHCKKCEKDKPDSEFNKDDRTRTGLQAWCKACFYLDARKRYHASLSTSALAGQPRIVCPKCQIPKGRKSFPQAKPNSEAIREWCTACLKNYRHEYEEPRYEQS